MDINFSCYVTDSEKSAILSYILAILPDLIDYNIKCLQIPNSLFKIFVYSDINTIFIYKKEVDV